MSHSSRISLVRNRAQFVFVRTTATVHAEFARVKPIVSKARFKLFAFKAHFKFEKHYLLIKKKKFAIVRC